MPPSKEKKRRRTVLVNWQTWEGAEGGEGKGKARKKSGGRGERAGVNLRLIKSCRIGRRGGLAPVHFVILAAKCPDAGADCLAALY